MMHAGLWSSALKIVNRLFSLTQTLVLARLLSPEDFGFFGIALLVLSTLDTFTQTGLRAALIQKSGEVHSYLDTVWTTQVIRGFVMAGIMLAFAPYVAVFFGEPDAAPLMQALAIIQVFRGLGNIGVVYFRRELEFHKEFIYIFSGTIVNLIVAIAAAFILRNAWALILGLLAGQFVQTIVSYIVHPYRPRVQLNWDKVQDLSIFGRWIIGSDLLVFLVTNGDSLLVGKFLGATSLGYYQIASRISISAVSDLADVIFQTTFPMYSKIQADKYRLKEAFLKTCEIVMGMTLPITIGTLFLGPSFVYIFLGSKWAPLIPTMQVLAVAGLLRSLIVVGYAFLRGTGLTRADFLVNLTRAIVFMALIYPLAMTQGIVGVALSVLLGLITAVMMWWILLSRRLGYSIKEFGGRLTPILLATGAMALVWSIAASIVSPASIFEWIGFGTLGVVVYLLCLIALQEVFGFGMLRTIHQLMRATYGR
jgi:O-antigen/teichoic acid export membrane protein